MISKEQKFIFVHNFKTGGTSIEKKLGHFDELKTDVQDHRTLSEIEALSDRGQHFRKCLHAFRKGKANRSVFWLRTAIWPELSRKEFDSFYKFTFVRNSWSRMYSWYANVMKDPHMRAIYKIDDDNYSYLKFLQEKVDHSSFSQLHFIKNRNGNVNMDFIGRFERLQEDFNVVATHLGIEDSELPTLLMRKYGHYSDNYDERTKDLIGELYKEEIDYFGFEFGE